MEGENVLPRFNIKTFGGQNSDKLLKNYAAEMSKVYGNAYKNNFEKYAATASAIAPSTYHLRCFSWPDWIVFIWMNPLSGFVLCLERAVFPV